MEDRMKKNNSLENRKLDLVSTGLCSKYDFISETKTKIENYTFDFAMDNEAQNILRMAVKELDLVDSQLERIERICKAVMKLDDKEVAEPCHIAEAIQYVVPPKKYM